MPIQIKTQILNGTGTLTQKLKNKNGLYQNLLFGARAGCGRSQNCMGGAGADIFLPGAGAEKKIWSLSRGKMARLRKTGRFESEL